MESSACNQYPSMFENSLPGYDTHQEKAQANVYSNILNTEVKSSDCSILSINSNKASRISPITVLQSEHELQCNTDTPPVPAFVESMMPMILHRTNVNAVDELNISRRNNPTDDNPS